MKLREVDLMILLGLWYRIFVEIKTSFPKRLVSWVFVFTEFIIFFYPMKNGEFSSSNKPGTCERDTYECDLRFAVKLRDGINFEIRISV